MALGGFKRFLKKSDKKGVGFASVGEIVVLSFFGQLFNEVLDKTLIVLSKVDNFCGLRVQTEIAKISIGGISGFLRVLRIKNDFIEISKLVIGDNERGFLRESG